MSILVTYCYTDEHMDTWGKFIETAWVQSVHYNISGEMNHDLWLKVSNINIAGDQGPAIIAFSDWSINDRLIHENPD